jgi:hypothetical protein
MLKTMVNDDSQDAVAKHGACFRQVDLEQVMTKWMNCLDLEA